MTCPSSPVIGNQVSANDPHCVLLPWRSLSGHILFQPRSRQCPSGVASLLTAMGVMSGPRGILEGRTCSYEPLQLQNACRTDHRCDGNMKWIRQVRGTLADRDLGHPAHNPRCDNLSFPASWPQRGVTGDRHIANPPYALYHRPRPRSETDFHHLNDVSYFWNTPSEHSGLFREAARPSNEGSGGFSTRWMYVLR